LHAEPNQPALLLVEHDALGQLYSSALTHHNLTSLLASLAPVFDLSNSDRLLSVLPLHQPFELVCGLLLPLSRGSSVLYPREATRGGLGDALRSGRVTAIMGQSEVWSQLRELASGGSSGWPAQRALALGLNLNRGLGRRVGIDAGWLVFAKQRARLGGHLRLLVSADRVTSAVRGFFGGLGLPISEVFGFPEAGAVLGVGKCKPGAVRSPHFAPLPDVEFKIAEPDADGVGEVWARGPNLMGLRNKCQPRRLIDAEGWLHTGQRGKLGRRGRLELEPNAPSASAAGRAQSSASHDTARSTASLAFKVPLRSSPVPELRLASESDGASLASGLSFGRRAVGRSQDERRNQHAAEQPKRHDFDKTT
jgi:long-chain acyl-CoA synthetase